MRPRNEILPAMPLDAAVMALVPGRIVESLNAGIPVGRIIMARLAWEEYSLVDESDWLVTIEDEAAHRHSKLIAIQARTQLSAWLASGELVNHEYMYEGVETCGIAFSDMFASKNFGKTVVKV